LVFDEDQVAKEYKFCERWSVHKPFALICKVEPGASSVLVEAELKVIELSVPELTVKAVVPVALAPAKLKAALILAFPCWLANATPPPPIGAAVVLSDVHCTELLMSCVLPSLKVPVAVNRWCHPKGIVWLTGVMVMPLALIVAALTVN
jgi:hypothetical protein